MQILKWYTRCSVLNLYGGRLIIGMNNKDTIVFFLHVFHIQRIKKRPFYNPIQVTRIYSL